MILQLALVWRGHEHLGETDDVGRPEFVTRLVRFHVVVPLLVAVGWVVFGPRRRITAADLGRFALVPVIWFAYTLVRGVFADWYPYPFVDVGEHGYARVLATGIAIGLGMMTLGLLAWWADGRLPASGYDAPRQPEG